MSETKKKRTTVEIFGQQYVIVGTESVEHVRLVASMVNQKMREISQKNPSLDSTKLAVLTAVNAVNDYVKIMEQLELVDRESKE